MFDDKYVNIVNQFIEHASNNPDVECCGVVVNNELIICKNISKYPDREISGTIRKEDDVESMKQRGMSVIDAGQYSIRYKNITNGLINVERISADTVNSALSKFAEAIALRGIGTRNVFVITISTDKFAYQFSGNLYDLLKKNFDDSLSQTILKAIKVKKNLKK